MTRRREKQLERLDAHEADFELRLVAALTMCAAGNNSMLFRAAVMRPTFWPRSVKCAVTDALLEAAEEILALRDQYELASPACLAARFREACRRHSDVEQAHRLGSRRDAQRLLDEILAPGDPDKGASR
jgi:hypothetical protein